MLCSSMKAFICSWLMASTLWPRSKPFSWHQSSMTLSARNRSLHSLQSISGSENPPTWPEATHTWGFIRMAASRPTL